MVDGVSEDGRSIYDRIRTVRERMERAAVSSAREAGDVALVAVTKTRSVEEIERALSSGFVRFIGENRVQEAETKKTLRSIGGGAAVPWRLIGHLQRNKARKALSLFDTVDGVDSPDLAATLQRILEEDGTNRILPVLIEINTSGEASKHGVTPEGAELLLETILGSCPRLRCDGLMTVGPMSDDEGVVRNAFARLRHLRETLSGRLRVPLKELSMGMSGDFEWAIMEGSTMVRIGSALFGPRVSAVTLGR
jgi:pyridoxal phosphate enzyme (YggS family)